MIVKKKIFYYSVFLLICILLYVSLNFSKIKDKAYIKYPNLELTKYLLKNKPLMNNIINDYNDESYN